MSETMQDRVVKIKVIGVGGGGGNAVSSCFPSVSSSGFTILRRAPPPSALP